MGSKSKSLNSRQDRGSKGTKRNWLVNKMTRRVELHLGQNLDDPMAKWGILAYLGYYGIFVVVILEAGHILVRPDTSRSLWPLTSSHINSGLDVLKVMLSLIHSVY